MSKVNNLDVTDSGINIIKFSESFSPIWYKCPAGKLTIGWGHVKTNADNFKMIGREMGEKLLKQDCKIAVEFIKNNVKTPLNQNQFNALVSFVFNIGVGQFEKSTMLVLLNDGKLSLAANEFPRWNKVKGKVSNGLVIRRAKERDLFLERGLLDAK